MTTSGTLQKSNLDFGLSFAINQMRSLPGNTLQPRNGEWQDSVIGSIALKSDIVTAADPSYTASFANHLATNADRLEQMGQIVSAGKLRGILDTLVEPNA